jgi:hypothetical protein
MGLNRPRAGEHTCPRHGCSVQVPNTRYACGQHWAELSAETKKAIIRTRWRNVLDPNRRIAFRMADVDWEQ